MPLSDKLNSWLKKHITPVFCTLILCWMGVRVCYYYSIINSPLYSLYLISDSDNKFFDDWAKYLTGDFLNKKPLHPYHWWHKSFADNYLKDHPEKLKEIYLQNTGKNSAFIPGKILWNEWYQGNQYHQEPLYAYLLAVFYLLNIDAVKAMIILQLVLGIVTGVLLFFITRKYFGETVAVVTGILYLLCGILMYNEVILLRTSWTVFLTILNVVVIDKAFSSHKLSVFFLCGLCIGFSFLMQSTFSLLLIGVLLITFFTGRQNFGSYIKNSGVLILGFCLVFSPVIARNLIVRAPAFSISSTAPVTFIVSNVYGTDTISAWNPSAKRDAEIMGRSYKSLSKAVAATMETYPSPLPFCVLEWRKLKAIWSGIEFPNNENYYFYKQFIPVLQYTGVNFFFIAPLALAGLLFCVLYKKKYYSLYLAIAVQLVTLLTFYILARMRVPLVILALPLAAFAIVECFSVWHKKKSIVFARIGIVGFLMYISFYGYSATLNDKMISDGDYTCLYYTHFADKLNDYAKKRQWDNYLKFQQQFIDMAPASISHIKEGDTWTNLNQVYLSQRFAKLHQARENIYNILGDKANLLKENNIILTLNTMAINYLNRSSIIDDLNKSVKEAYYDRGVLYTGYDINDSALADFNKAIALDSAYSDAYESRALFYLKVGKNDLALADFSKALKLYSVRRGTHFGIKTAYYNRASLYYAEAKKDLAITDLTSAINIDTGYVSAYTNRGLIYYKYNENNLAMKDFTKAIDLDTTIANAYSDRALLYLTSGKSDSVLSDLNKAIIHDPMSPLYCYNRGLFYESVNDYKKAIDDFTSGMKLNPVNIELYYYMRGICYNSLEEYNEAISDFSEAITINPLIADFWLNRSFAENKIGEADNAKVDALRAQQLK